MKNAPDPRGEELDRINSWFKEATEGLQPEEMTRFATAIQSSMGNQELSRQELKNAAYRLFGSQNASEVHEKIADGTFTEDLIKPKDAAE